MKLRALFSMFKSNSILKIILNITIITFFIWTLVVGGSLIWNLMYIETDGMERAFSEAIANINKDLTFRKWATEHGGVYVPVTENQKSVSWMDHVPGRDVTTKDGKKLTLLNPASMLRQIMDRYAKEYGIRGRITGLKYLNPENAPDIWEKQQMEAFTAGEKKEVWAIVEMEGKPYLRYLRAMYMESGCEKCHAILGYKLGDMRGATGVNLPLTSYFEQIKNSKINMILSHLLIWLLGLIGIIGSSHIVRRGEKNREVEESTRKQSEERFRNLASMASEGIMIHDKGIILDANQAFANILGYNDPEEVIGKNAFEITHFTSESRQNVLEHFKTGSNEKYDIELLNLKGEKISAQTRGIDVVFKDKNVRLILLYDITDRKFIEESVLAEKERLLVTLRSIGDGVIATDIRGNIVIMNPIAEMLTGWNQNEAVGKPIETVFNIINELTRLPSENPVKKVLLTGHTIELANHTLLISRDGTERVIADSGAPIKDSRNLTQGVVLVFRDMTEKQKLLDSIQRTSKLDSLGILAGGIAHDFNNLLVGIYGNIDMAISISQDKQILDYLSNARTTIDRTRGLTQQLLTFAKGGTPIMKMSHLFPFIQETALFALSGSKISCHFKVPHDLYACDFDKNQIGQVIDNLIINAEQAMPLGGTIVLSAENCFINENENPLIPKGKYVKISIKDTGIGIPKDILARIFDPFFTTKTKGHGLGLASCYSIINRHGGCIEVESEPGKGSTFRFFLPASSNIVSSTEEHSRSEFKGSGVFLVVDDEDVILDVMREILKSIGYEVVCLKNGEDAVEYFKSEKNKGQTFAGLIFDLTIAGGMGGREAIKEIRKLDTDTPAFVISGYSEDPIIASPMDYGFTASICKPFGRSEIMELFHKYLNIPKDP